MSMMLTCREVSEVASDYLDGQLGWVNRLRVRAHLAMCRRCRDFVAQLADVIVLLQNSFDAPVPVDVEERLIQSLRTVRRRQRSDYFPEGDP